MKKIAFFIAEIADNRTQALIEGAVSRACQEKISLIICPGRYLVSAGHRETGLPDYFQETAVFDYISETNADALIIDLGEITKHASARKKEDFVKRYSFLPQVLIEKQEKGKEKDSFYAASSLQEAEEILTADGDDFFAVGSTAVDKAIAQIKALQDSAGHQNQIKPAGTGKAVAEIKAAAREKTAAKKKKNTDRVDRFEKTGNQALLEETAHKFFHHNFQEDANPYNLIMERAARFGAQFGAFCLFPDAVIYTRDNEWTIPENILVLSLLQNADCIRLKEAIPISVEDVIADAVNDEAEPFICILNSIYLNDRQIGLMVTEFTDAFAEKYVNSLFMYMVTGAVRLIANDQQLMRTQDVLTENKKRIEKDSSVLERLGDEDYLTKKLNRRGFFSKAYDKLSKKFVEGTYAIVSYIDIDSIKSINAFFGREEGDNAVKRIAEILEQVFGKECVLGRIRGNEFAVLLVTRDDSLSEMLREEMSKQNLSLMKDTSKPYIIHLQYSICAFKHREGLSLKEMLSETDDNLQKIRQI